MTISNAGGGTLSFTAIATITTPAGAKGLTLSQASGQATPSSPAILTVTADPTGLWSGTFTGTVSVTAGSTALSVPVTITVGALDLAILLSQRGLLFTAVAHPGDHSGRDVEHSESLRRDDASLVVSQLLPAGTDTRAALAPGSLLFAAAAGPSSPGSQNVQVYNITARAKIGCNLVGVQAVAPAGLTVRAPLSEMATEDGNARRPPPSPVGGHAGHHPRHAAAVILCGPFEGERGSHAFAQQ